MALDRKRLLKPVKKLRKLVRNLDRQPAPEQVHDLRTSTRRVEAAFEALSPEARGVGKFLMKDLRRCRKRAGTVRDMDVLTQYASSVHLAGEEECTVRLLEHLGALRQKYATKLYSEVRRVRSELRRNLRRTGAKLAKLVQTNKDNPDRSTVGPKAAGAAVTLVVQLAVPKRLDRRNLHPYRLKVKELRNVLQMAPTDTTRFVDDLAKVKDAIGEWHDWEELVSMAQKELDHGNRCGLVAELKRIAGSKYDHALSLALSLRRTYLRSSHPQENGSSTAPPSVPREPVWEAIARLAETA
jgi:CHAD domain-containing protein